MEDIELSNMEELENLLKEDGDQKKTENAEDKIQKIEAYKQRVLDLASIFVHSQPKSPLIPLVSHELSKAYEIALFDDNNDLAIKIRKLVQQASRSKCTYDQSLLKEYCAEFLPFLLKKTTKECECYKSTLFYCMQQLLDTGIHENLEFVVAVWKKVPLLNSFLLNFSVKECPVLASTP